VLLQRGEQGRGVLLVDQEHVYRCGDSGSIVRVPKNGGESTLLVEEFDSIDGCGLHDGHLYWTTEGRLRRLSIARPNEKTDDLVSGTPSCSPAALFVDPSGVYFQDARSLNILRMRHDGTEIVALCDLGACAEQLATDEQYLYLLDGGGKVVRVEKSGRGTVALPTNIEPAEFMAADPYAIYVSTWSTATIYRCEKAKAAWEPIASIQWFPRSLAVDATGVYWTRSVDGAVMRANQNDWKLEQLANGQNGSCAIATDENCIYWINEDDGSLMWIGKS
jgi:hypothetical protein